MKLDLETLIPLGLVALVVATLFFNNSTPTVSRNGYSIVKPTKDFELIRGIEDVKEEDNIVTITHIDRPDDKLNLRLWHDYIVFPRDKDGKPIIPTRKAEDGTTDIPLWKVEAIRKDYGVELGWDIGAYGGYLSGSKEGTEVKSLDVGVRIAPLRIWNCIATDILFSNQAAGVGISFYPAPERFGEFWNHVGIGYGRMLSFDDDCSRGLFYLSISSRF